MTIVIESILTNYPYGNHFVAHAAHILTFHPQTILLE